MTVNPDAEIVANNGDKDAKIENEATRGRESGTTSGTENYGSTEEANKLNLPDTQTEPNY